MSHYFLDKQEQKVLYFFRPYGQTSWPQSISHQQQISISLRKKIDCDNDTNILRFLPGVNYSC